jgi:DNA-binding transcriptional ArsR family regulator
VDDHRSVQDEPDDAELDELVKAVANATRRHILRLCAGGFVPAGDIAARIDLAPASVSEHLKVLRKTGLVVLRRVGTQWLYQTDAETVAGVLAALAADLDVDPHTDQP